MSREFQIATESEMRDLGAKLGLEWSAGDVVFLEGSLGAGKQRW